MMTNKQSQFAKAQFLSDRPLSDLGTPLDQMVLPLCGGVVGEAIAQPSTQTQVKHLSTATPIKWGETAIALVISGTVLAWLTTIPTWWPQTQVPTYSTTLSNAALVSDP